jgi:hypothetical protein
MASPSRLQVTELDFDTIKENLKNFLKQQETFQDYDFEGSGLSILLDTLAYNTHYNAYYLNMVANEAFLDSAVIRDSVVSHAKSLSYTPYSVTASKAIIDLEIVSTNNNPGTLQFPRGTIFASDLLDNTSYNFVLIDDVSATKANSSYLFEGLEIYEGEIVTYNYQFTQQTNPKAIFTIPDANIDTKTLKVVVIKSGSSNEQEVYTLAKNAVEVGSNDAVYFLQEGRNGRYQIYFGNDIIGKSIDDNSIVQISYLVTQGSVANGIDGFILSSEVNQPFSTISINVVGRSAGGSDRETIDEIKYGSTKLFTAQNRLVTYKDYESYIVNAYPNIESISVWGGEDEPLPVYGKVFVALKMRDGFFISEIEKQRIVNEVIRPKSIVSVDTIIKDPEFLFVKVVNDVRYLKNKTVLTEEQLRVRINDEVLNYFNTNVNKFNSRFALSKLVEDIDNLDESIVGIQSRLRLEKRFKPLLNNRVTYTINFNASLSRGSTFNRLVSDEFDVFDNRGVRRLAQIEEVPESFTGVSDIIITNPGSGYTSPPTVTITGDGTGATAVAKIVNGRIESISVTNRGRDYTRALVSISGGNGFGGQSSAILDNRFGTLRLVYFDTNAERQIINPNLGTINYDTGEITLNNLNILATYSNDGLIRINVQSQNEVIESIRNNIITIDSDDATSIVTNLISV